MSEWPKHPDGRNMKIGEMTPEQRRQVTKEAVQQLQKELCDPNSSFRKNCEAIIRGPVIPRTRQ